MGSFSFFPGGGVEFTAASALLIYVEDALRIKIQHELG